MSADCSNLVSHSKLVIFFTALLPFMATAQFSFNVTDEKGIAVGDAFCIINCSSNKKEQSGFTNEQGVFKLHFGGTCDVQVKKLGYKPFINNITVSETTTIQLEEDNIDMKDVVITGQSQPTTISLALQSIKVVDQQKIQSMGAVNLRDILTNQLNMRLSMDPATGVSGVKLNGISGQGVKIMIDGVPIIGRTDGDIDLSQINLSNIERVEIIEGPMSVIYGSDALGGVINLISKKKISHHVNTMLRGYYESAGIYNAEAKIGFKIKGVEISLAGGRNYFGGFDPNYTWQQRVQQWKPREQYFNNNSISFRTGLAKHSIASDLFIENITSHARPDTGAFSITASDLRFRTQRWNIRSQSDLWLTGENSLQLINSFQYYHRNSQNYIKNLVSGELGNPTSETVDIFYSALLRGIWTNNKLKQFTFRSGYDFNLDFGEGVRLQNNKQQVLDFAGYATIQYRPIEKLAIEGGLRASYNTRYQAPVLPSANIRYNIHENWSIRASYAMGFRAPALKELDFFFTDGNHNVFGNSTLRAEKSHNVQASINYERIINGFKLNFRPSAYFNQVYNKISMAALPIGSSVYHELLSKYNFDTTNFTTNNPPYSYFNIDEFQSVGVNWQGGLSHQYFDVQLAYGLTGIYTNLVSDSLREMQKIPHFVWSHEATVAATGRLPKFKIKGVDFVPTISVFYKYNGKQPNYTISLDQNDAIQTMIGEFSIMDITATVKIWRDIFVLSGGVKNVMNVTSIRATGNSGGAHSAAATSMSVGMGRTGFVSLAVNFNYDFKKN